MDFNSCELYTQIYTQKYSHLNTENSKKYLPYVTVSKALIGQIFPRR